MNTTPAPKDLNWIKSSLQSAIELEFSTLPLYLSAMFSLEVQNYTAYNAIRSVAMEEMVHMAIVANMLAALGGTPSFAKLKVKYPTQGLPGGAEPDLHIGLAAYSALQLKNFMRIETPQFLLKKLKLSEQYPTIAVFYNDIKKAILNNADAVRAAVKAGGTSNQVGDDIGFSTFAYQEGSDAVAMLCAGIDEILEQGEGAAMEQLMTSTEFESEESHYVKFAELFYGAKYQQPPGGEKINDANEAAFFKGEKIGRPVVVNTLAVPADGYAAILKADPNGAAVNTALTGFDNSFSTMLTTLDTVWNGPAAGSWKSLGAAVHGMVDFRVLSCFMIMRTAIPDSVMRNLKEIYPDEFAYISKYTDLTRPVYYGPRFINTNN